MRCSLSIGGGTGGGRPRPSGVRPTSRKNCSPPEGVSSVSMWTVSSPSVMNVCGTSRGPKTNEPGPASISSSPQTNRTCPAMTQNASSSRRWTCSGGEAPTGIHDSTSPYAPPVDAAVAFTVIRFWKNHVASPSPAADQKSGVPTSITSIGALLIAHVCNYCADVYSSGRAVSRAGGLGGGEDGRRRARAPAAPDTQGDYRRDRRLARRGRDALRRGGRRGRGRLAAHGVPLLPHAR